MAITTKLELRQTHNLVMTPQLQQAIKLLQLSNMELASFVETELERNPLLERADPEETGGPASSGQSSRWSQPPRRLPSRMAPAPLAEAAKARPMARTARWVDLETGGQPDRGSRRRAARRVSRCRRLLARCPQGFRLEHARPRLARQRRRGLKSRILRGRGANAQGPSNRTARARLRRSRPPPDRSASHRHDRRGRLSARRSGQPRRACSARPSNWSRRRSP